MDRLDIFLPVCICMMLVAVVVIQHLRYRTVMKEKNYAVFHQIKEQTRLARELEQTRTEKETLEKLVIERINPKPKPPSPSGLPPQEEGKGINIFERAERTYYHNTITSTQPPPSPCGEGPGVR